MATWATKISCSSSASSTVSFARRSIGLRNNTIRARVALPRTSTPAGISRASAIGPSATTSGGHCTLSGSFGDDPRDLIDRDVERGQPVLPAPLDRLVGLQHRHVEPLGAAAPARDRRREAADRACRGPGGIPAGRSPDRRCRELRNRHATIVTVGSRRRAAARVRRAQRRLSRDSLSIVNVPRRCCRPGCPHYAVATLTFVYSDSTAVVGPLATASRTAFVGPVRRPRRPDHRAARLGTGPPRRPAARRIPTRTIWWRWPTPCARARDGVRSAPARRWPVSPIPVTGARTGGAAPMAPPGGASATESQRPPARPPAGAARPDRLTRVAATVAGSPRADRLAAKQSTSRVRSSAYVPARRGGPPRHQGL